ncbi:MAG: DUF4147 domain-containing protein [Balneolaceae bacterium]
MDLTEQAQQIFTDTLSHVNPAHLIKETLTWSPDTGNLSVKGQTFKLKEKQPVYLIGSGKACVSMALAVEQVMGNRISDGIVIAPDPYKGSSITQVFKGSHPLPDKESLSSSYEMLTFLKKLPDDAFVFNLVSGGTSSLFCLPADDLEIEELREIYALLIESGATIHEINTVRKVFSAVKGGQLLSYLEGKQLVDLMISDITDDDIEMIGSGPSVAQSISASDAFKILKQYHLYNRIPHAARRFLALEMNRESRNDQYRTTRDIDHHDSFIIGSALMMAQKAEEFASKAGFKTNLRDKPVTGPVEQVKSDWLDIINNTINTSDEPSAIIWFGEPTVNVTGGGLGGRNQELALQMAMALDGMDKKVAFLSAGSDGIDGPTDAAGAVVTPDTCADARRKKISPEDYLANNDSYNFFKLAGGHVITGPTGNNLMDLHITLVQ